MPTCRRRSEEGARGGRQGASLVCCVTVQHSEWAGGVWWVGDGLYQLPVQVLALDININSLSAY